MKTPQHGEQLHGLFFLTRPKRKMLIRYFRREEHSQRTNGTFNNKAGGTFHAAQKNKKAPPARAGGLSLIYQESDCSSDDFGRQSSELIRAP